MQMEIKRKLEEQYSYQIKDFKIKNVTRDKEGHDIMIKVSIQEEDITLSLIHISEPTRPY